MTAAAKPVTPAPGVGLTRQKVSAILAAPEAQSQIMPLLPRGVSLEAVLSEVNRAVVENPEILEATPASIILAVSQCVKWDLEIGQTVHLVPFNVKVSKRGEADRWEKRIKALRDYKGMVEMVVRAGAARAIDAKNIYKNEIFKYHEGTDPWIEHYPIVDPKERGPQTGSYAVARLSHYLKKIVVLSVAEIEEVRTKHSKQWKIGPLPDWYGPKTCVHRVTKLIPKNPKLAAVLAEFAKEEEPIPDGEFEVVGEERSGAVAPSSAQPEQPAAPESKSDREAIADSAPTGDGLAPKDLIYDMLDMLEHDAIPEGVREKVRAAIRTGVKEQIALTWKGMLEEKIGEWRASNELFAGAKA